MSLNKGATLWLTGLSGAGKSTLSEVLGLTLSATPPGGWPLNHDACRVEILDGDLIRQTLSKGLGFSKEDRDENIRRIGFVAHLLSRNGVLTIVSAISPYREVRAEVKALHHLHEVPFFEVFVDADMEVLVERDTKGLYRQAADGKIKLSGLNDPYEAPYAPDLTVRTDVYDVEQCVAKIINHLVLRDVLNARYLRQPPRVGDLL